jgi:CRISPR/Cas system-associated exonuclease Cas4 (RecB family)
MASFLEIVAEKICKHAGERPDEVAIILPSRRAVVFMREALAKAYGTTIWSPYIAAIQDFVRDQYGGSFPEDLSLLLNLYTVYRQRMQKLNPAWHEPFERFYPWGEMLLRDFDEVDKYLVSPDELFTNVKDLREIELTFGLSEEDREAVKQFWNAVYVQATDEEGQGKTREQFLSIWGILLEVYQDFRNLLLSRNQAYDGMAYRAIAERAKDESLELSWQHTFFVGFNALTGSEEVLMNGLLNKKKATIFWDVDEHFLTTDTPIGEEAGFFILKQHKKWEGKGSELIQYASASHEKQIEIIGAPLSTGQARYAGNILRAIELQPQEARHTALVLADEQMLFPLLHALPKTVSRLNITMGFPLKQTDIHHLLQSVLKLVQRLEFDAGNQVFFPYDILFELLSNAWLQVTTNGEAQVWKHEIAKKNLVLVPAYFFEKKATNPLTKALFSPPNEKEKFIPWLDKLFAALMEDVQSREALLESEYAFQLYTRFNQFKTALADFTGPISLYGLAAMLAESFKRARIPFEGEPLEGLQIMGFLETRNLDFDRVIMLGVNEGKLPSTSAGNSYIPYHLRRGFGMPTFEQKDAIFAYHFFRLMMRAKSVFILYNNQQNETGGPQEMSRYLHQLKHFGDAFPRWKIRQYEVSVGAPFSEVSPIVIPATEETRQILYKRYIHEASGEALAPTALTTWLACKLRFYYHYIAGIREPETLSESMEANTFGSILHGALELIYEPWLGKIIRPQTINTELYSRVRNCLEEAFKREANLTMDDLRGRNYLMRDVLEQLCHDVLDKDAEDGTFQLEGLEKHFTHRIHTPMGKVRISGIADRLDKLATGEYRIVDYKTGKLDFGNEKLSLEDVFNNEYGVDKKGSRGIKEAFQGYMYSWLLLQDKPKETVKTGFYVFKNLSQGLLFLNEGEALSETVFDEMDGRMSKLLQRIFHEDYTQTENEKLCTYCPYKGICQR